MIKKTYTGIFLGLIAFGLIYLYFMYMGNPNILWNWIQEYKIYTSIFFISLVIIYTLQGTNKIYNFLILVIILINIFIIGDVFFKNNIGLNSQQFIVLFGLILLALAITYITHRIRYIFMGVVGVGIIFVLLTGILPMYENIPNINDFISSQKTKIINQGINKDGILIIKNNLGTKEIPINEIQQNDIDLSTKTQISLATKTQSKTGNVFIDIGNGAFVNINPQSAITLEKSGENVLMQILQGNIEYYIPPEFSGAIDIIGKYKGKNIQDIQNTIRGNLVDQFKQKQEDFFVNQIGGSIILNPVINKVINFFITTLYTISPNIYQKNLTNYTTIQKYFGNETIAPTRQTTTGEDMKSIINDIMSQVKKGSQETTIINKLLNK